MVFENFMIYFLNEIVPTLVYLSIIIPLVIYVAMKDFIKSKEQKRKEKK